MNRLADDAKDELRISVDTKAAVKVGRFSRRGKSRIPVDALDHDYDPDAVLVPVGILLPKTGELLIDFIRSPVTADAIVDSIESFWQDNGCRFPGVKRLVINQDNGPENNSRRTQFMARMVQFADTTALDIRLAYYPPYHSKYNPIERCWGALENKWNGSLLDSIETVLGRASHMTWKGKSPVVRLVDTVYETGKKLGKAAMDAIEARLDRLDGLGRWFVDIAHALA